MADSTGGGLQFDRADYGEGKPGAVCATCQAPIHDVYYQVGGRMTCERCHAAALVAGTSGSGLARFAKAMVAGSVAGGVGAGIWYAVLALFHMQVGLIAIVVGLLVGSAVRWGSAGRGGWLYQLLAVFITYTAICSTYVPLLWDGIKKGVEEKAHAGDAAGATPNAPLTPGRALAVLVIGGALLMAFAYAVPILSVFSEPSSIISLLIIGFALWEAWKLNRVQDASIAGPFRLGQGAGG